MVPILGITGPIYLAIALGYFSTRSGWFSKAEMRVFGRFVIHVALPCLLFNVVAKRDIADILNARYLLAYLGGTLCVIALGLLWGRRSGLVPTDNVVAVMGMSCSNSGYVGYPILLLILTPVASIALALNMVLESLIVIPLLLVLAERSKGAQVHWLQTLVGTLKQLLGNPLLIPLAAGLLVSLLRLKLPEPIWRTMSLFSDACAGLSLFVIGGTLVGLPLQGMGKQITPIMLGKLMAHPLAVFLAIQLLPWLGLVPLEPSLQTAAVLLAAMPMMGIYPIFAQSYGKEDLGAAALLLTTVMSFLTLNCLLWLTHLG